MFYSTLFSLLLTGLVSAVPTSKPPSTSPSYCKSPSVQNATFDDIGGLPGSEFNDIPNPYKGLYFQAFASVNVIKTQSLPGPRPHSGSSFAASNVVSQLLQGSPEWTTNYPGSNVKSFSLKSFYYACVLNLGQAVTAPNTACNIAITGFAKGDDTAEAVQVVSQEFSYNPTTATGAQQMALGTFKSEFQNLQYVLIQFTLPGGTAAAGVDLALLVDDVEFTTCSK